MLLRLGAHRKEGGCHVVCIELVEHPRRDGRFRAIVKRHMHGL